MFPPLHNDSDLRYSIWHMTYMMEDSSLGVWPIDDHNFRVSVAGKYVPVLSNPTYTLIERKYALFFEHLQDQVVIKNAVIHDFKLKTENHNYISLKIINPITPDTIDFLNANGDKVWDYMGHIFISRDLKEKLRAFDSQRLRFDPGFSYFG